MAELFYTPLISDANLEGYYRFESGALTTDSSGDGETLTNTNSVGETTGKYGGAADLGSGDHNKDFRRSSNYGLTGIQDMTFVGWFKLNAEISSGEYHLFSLETTLSTARYLFFTYQYNSGTRRLRANVGGTGTSYNVDLGTANWHHIAYVRESNVPKIYLNGTLVVSGTAGSGTSTDNRVYIGRQTDGNNDAAIDIDDFAILSRALTLSEIQMLYKDFVGRSLSF